MPEQKENTAVPEPIASSLAKARETGRLLFIDFYAEWCAACKTIESTIIPAPEVQRALESFIFLKVDIDEYPQCGERYDVDAMPTLLVLNGEGQELYRLVGLIEPQQLAEQLLDLL